MTYQEHCTLPESLLEQIVEQGLGVLPKLVRIFINMAMQVEWEQHTAYLAQPVGPGPGVDTTRFSAIIPPCPITSPSRSPNRSIAGRGTWRG